MGTRVHCLALGYLPGKSVTDYSQCSIIADRLHATAAAGLIVASHVYHAASCGIHWLLGVALACLIPQCALPLGS